MLWNIFFFNIKVFEGCCLNILVYKFFCYYIENVNGYYIIVIKEKEKKLKRIIFFDI